MHKTIYIEPKSPNQHVFSQFPLPRLGVFILTAILNKKGEFHSHQKIRIIFT
jgi:hypothetical protein